MPGCEGDPPDRGDNRHPLLKGDSDDADVAFMTYPQPPAPEAGLAPVAGVISGPALPRPGEIDRARRMLDGEGLAPPEAVAAALLARTVEAVRLWSSA